MALKAKNIWFAVTTPAASQKLSNCDHFLWARILRSSIEPPLHQMHVHAQACRAFEEVAGSLSARLTHSTLPFSLLSTLKHTPVHRDDLGHHPKVLIKDVRQLNGTDPLPRADELSRLVPQPHKDLLCFSAWSRRGLQQQQSREWAGRKKSRL